MATVMLDRVLDRADVIQITEKSYRLKNKACKTKKGGAKVWK